MRGKRVTAQFLQRNQFLSKNSNLPRRRRMSDLLSDSGAGNGESIVTPDSPILVTGASGFIGAKVVETLLESGFTNLRCFVRPSSRLDPLRAIIDRHSARET